MDRVMPVTVSNGQWLPIHLTLWRPEADFSSRGGRKPAKLFLLNRQQRKEIPRMQEPQMNADNSYWRSSAFICGSNFSPWRSWRPWRLVFELCRYYSSQQQK
jgi:hypothetical protein